MTLSYQTEYLLGILAELQTEMLRLICGCNAVEKGVFSMQEALDLVPCSTQNKWKQ